MIHGIIFQFCMLFIAWKAAESGRSIEAAVFVTAGAISYMLGLILDAIKEKK